MLATIAAADNASTVRKKFLYIAKRNHMLCTLYINIHVHCVFYSIIILCSSCLWTKEILSFVLLVLESRYFIIRCSYIVADNMLLSVILIVDNKLYCLLFLYITVIAQI